MTRSEMLRHYNSLIASSAEGRHGDISVTIHSAMFKIAQAHDSWDLTGVAIAKALGVQDSYKSEWPKIRKLVDRLRLDGVIT